MFRRIFLTALIVYPCSLLAQNNTSVKTDSSVIETKYYKDLNSIRIFNKLNGQDKIYYTNYYYDTHTINEKGVFLNGYYTGIVKTFWPNGKLKLQVDYNNSKINFYDKKAYPFFDYQNTIKLKADNIIKDNYSAAFFKKYVVWDISTSYIYNNLSSGSWVDALEGKPTRFLLRYAIIWAGKRYSELIEFELDSKGKLIKDGSFKGFEKLPNNGSAPTFNLTPKQAIAAAIKNGMIDTGNNKAYSYLTWQENKTVTTTGNFRIYVVKKVASIKDINPKGRSTIIDKYNAYIFNPWSGALVEKKKMKNVRGWERESGSSTGLIPDL